MNEHAWNRLRLDSAARGKSPELIEGWASDAHAKAKRYWQERCRPRFVGVVCSVLATQSLLIAPGEGGPNGTRAEAQFRGESSR